MKNILLYNYNINIEKLIEKDENSYNFYIDYNNYYFLRLKRPIQELEEIVLIMEQKQNQYHKIIKNRFNKVVTEYNNELYILIKINGAENCEIDLLEILKNQITVNNHKKKLILRNNWSELWSQKVDYLEYQMSELGKNHILAIKSFSYFIGIAENAITYYNDLNNINAQLALVQKRIQFPNINLNFYNPLNLVIDYRIRDIAEYLKSAFYNNYDIIKEIDNIIEKNFLTPIEYNLIFARLLFPSNYFDDLTKVIENNEDDEILIKYLSITREYESFLKKIFLKFSSVCVMQKIEWLLN